MKQVTLQVKEKVPSLTGAPKYVWTDSNTLYISLYETNDMLVTQSVHYHESTHVGLTFYKGIKDSINRLVDEDGVVYDVTRANSRGRLSSLLLKEVRTSG